MIWGGKGPSPLLLEHVLYAPTTLRIALAYEKQTGRRTKRNSTKNGNSWNREIKYLSNQVKRDSESGTGGSGLTLSEDGKCPAARVITRDVSQQAAFRDAQSSDRG